MARLEKRRFIHENDKVLWNEFVSEFYGLEPEDQNNILAMDTDTGTGKKKHHKFTLAYSIFQNSTKCILETALVSMLQIKMVTVV